MATATYTGDLTDFAEAPFPTAVPKLTVYPKQDGFGAKGLLSTRRIPITVASNGSFSFQLVPSAQTLPPQSYILRCEWLGSDYGYSEWEFTAAVGGGNIKTMGVIDEAGLYRQAVLETLGPLVDDAVSEAIEANPNFPHKAVYREGNNWIWAQPGGPAATHFVFPDSTGSYVVRPTAWPIPMPTPGFN